MHAGGRAGAVGEAAACRGAAALLIGGCKVHARVAWLQEDGLDMDAWLGEDEQSVLARVAQKRGAFFRCAPLLAAGWLIVVAAAAAAGQRAVCRSSCDLRACPGWHAGYPPECAQM